MNEERDKKIISLLETHSQKEVAEIFGLSQAGVGLIAKKHGIKLKKSRLNCSTLNLDINYFENIDRPQKAYWLGFICADGYIGKDDGRISICVKDLEILEKFKKDIGSGHKISEIKNFDRRTGKFQNEYSIQITNSLFTKNVIKHGVTNKKTDILKFPEMDEKYWPFFIAGLFDGDGCVYKTKGQNGIKCSLISTEEVLNKIDEILFNKFSVKPCKHCKVSENKENVYKQHWYKESETFLNYIYSGEKEMYLSRKYDFYKGHNYTDKVRNGEQPILQYSSSGEFIKKYSTIKEAAKETGLNEGGIIGAYKNSIPYKGYFWVKYEKNSKINEYITVEKRYKYEIQQINASGEIVSIFHTLREAEEKTGIKHPNICMCLKGKLKQTKGYTWKRITVK